MGLPQIGGKFRELFVGVNYFVFLLISQRPKGYQSPPFLRWAFFMLNIPAHKKRNRTFISMVTLSTLTVGQFQALYAVQKSNQDELDKITDCVAILTGKTSAEVDDMPLSEFNAISAQIRQIFSQPMPEAKAKQIIKANGKEYGITYTPGKLRAGQYVEYQGWIQGDLVDNLHMILASISYPVKKYGFLRRKGVNDSSKHEHVANDFKEAKFIDVYGACLFFCELLKGSIKALEGFLVKELKGIKTTKEVKQLVTDLLNSLDGFTPQNRSLSLKV